MKQLHNASRMHQFSMNATKLISVKSGSFFSMLVLSGVLLLGGCKKEAANQSVNDTQQTSAMANTDQEVLTYYTGLDKSTMWELQQARAATAKDRNIKNAIADGYADISVVVPNMGFHYMKSAYVDGTFDIRHPEILVYNRNEDGSIDLVAVEYAVPIPLTPTVAPEGFTGTADVWDRNTGFNLWLLHAWVWKNNSLGVFNPTNPAVHLH